GLDRRRRAAVPVGRVLEPVRVEVVGAWDMPLGVLLGHAEVDMEEKERCIRWRLRAPAGEDVSEPRDVDEGLVSRQPLEWKRVVGRPGGRASAEGADGLDASSIECRGESVDVAGRATDQHDLAIGGDALLLEQAPDLWG